MQLSTGDELWKRELDTSIEMMPTRFGENLGDIDYTLDNYRAPLLLDGRLFLFYESSTSFDARTGKEKEREKFKINEDGLALTEADPVFDDQHVYVSGKGKIRAVNRRTGKQDWEADDLGISAEMALVGNVLYVRTGGQFTLLKDGEQKEKGPFGVSAINTADGKTLWRYKGADKGLTTSSSLIKIPSSLQTKTTSLPSTPAAGSVPQTRSQNRQSTICPHKRKRPSRCRRKKRDCCVPRRLRLENAGTMARSSHGSGARCFRIVTGIALRAAALYFRYGGIATSAIGLHGQV